jgi:hypothetical protein
MIIEKILDTIGNPIFITSEMVIKAANEKYPLIFQSKRSVCAFLKRNGYKKLENENTEDGRWTILEDGRRTNRVIYYNANDTDKKAAVNALMQMIVSSRRKRGRPRKN